MKQSYAPFGSLTRKKKNNKSSDMPGPGSYNISLPMIEPIIQTIHKKNNNVIVKLGHIGTAAFQNNHQRFHQPDTSTVGPGQYQVQKYIHHRKPRIIRSNAASKLAQIIDMQQNLPTIQIPKNIKLDEYFQMPSKDEFYQKEDKVKKSRVKGTDWSKIVEKKLENDEKSMQLGPGYYQLPSNRSKSQLSPSPAFVSESARSFFDHIMFETNKDGKARQRLQMNYKSDSIGPGSYQLINNKQKVSKYQFFGSTSDRM